MKIDTSSVKKGTILNVEGRLFKVIDISHTHTGRGSATYSFKAKNIIDGGNQLLTYKSGTTLEQADVATKNAVFLYNNGESYSFMENDTAEIYDLDGDNIEDVVPYLKENLDCFLMIYNGNVIGVILPNTIEYTVVSTVPGVKGDRASTGKKPATLDNGLEVQVALHVSEGAVVRVNTTTGETA
ncbi:MAG: elongation factor P [Candidatus Peribacteria bacterium]|nr:MAG: elongation factor P [Candidatus Peribacteria bacterium]